MSDRLYIIKAIGKELYWSNEQGWVDIKYPPNTFSQEDTMTLNLPVGGCWYKIRKVVIEVSGGVADVTECPDDVEVEIIDHDNEECGEE